jgi:hypothetical protein
MLVSDDSEIRLFGLRLALTLDVPLWGSWGGVGPNLYPGSPLTSFWSQKVTSNAEKFKEDVTIAAAIDKGIRLHALRNGLVSVEGVLNTEGGLHLLLQAQPAGIFGVTFGAYLLSSAHFIAQATNAHSLKTDLDDLTAFGKYLHSNPRPPWARGPIAKWSVYTWEAAPAADTLSQITPMAYLGAAGALLMSAELDTTLPSEELNGAPSRLGYFKDLYHYIERRHTSDSPPPLPELPVPHEFKQVFRDWAEGKMNFTAPAPGALGQD